MKFGEHLKVNSLANWKSDYINYDLLKSFIKQHPNWQDQDQFEFQRLITNEYNRLTNLIDNHVLTLTRRIQNDDWVDILLDIYDFSRFVQLNQTAFDKIIKKHKKWTGRSIQLAFTLVFDDVALYTSLRSDPGGGSGQDNGNNSSRPSSSINKENKPNTIMQPFTSKKYWLNHDHVPQVVANLCMHMLVDHHSTLSNFYMDNDRMECYLDRLNDKEDAEMIKFKSYQDEACIEHEIHNTFHSGDVQYKQRDQIYNMDLASLWQKSANDFMFVNNSDVRHAIISRELRIVLQCDYTRIRFYAPQYPSLIVTLDTSISYSKPGSSKTCFRYAVLEVKQTGTDPSQAIPLKGLATLIENVSVLHHVPKFSKYLQGIYQLYSSEKLAALPSWIELEKKGWTSFTPVLRPSPTTSSSSTTAVATTQPDYTSIHISDSDSDDISAMKKAKEKERELEDEDEEEEVVVEEEDEQNHDEERDETYPTNMRPIRSKPKRLIAYDQEGNPVYKQKKNKVKQSVEATIKIEPKVFFANERTFIAWLQFCALLLTVALNLLNFGDLISRICGALFLGIAVILSLYALVRFQYRAKMLRNHCQGRYDDIYGPAVLCLLIVGALVINFWLRFR